MLTSAHQQKEPCCIFPSPCVCDLKRFTFNTILQQNWTNRVEIALKLEPAELDSHTNKPQLPYL